jgi:hypothetical protein
MTGSFNFSKAAEESNAGNLLVFQDSALAAKFTATGWSTPSIRSLTPGRQNRRSEQFESFLPVSCKRRQTANQVTTPGCALSLERGLPLTRWFLAVSKILLFLIDQRGGVCRDDRPLRGF